MNQLSCHTDVCNLWRLTALAADLGVKVGCASNWRSRDKGRGFVPPWYWSRLIEMAERRHGVVLTYRQLALMTEHRLPVCDEHMERREHA